MQTDAEIDAFIRKTAITAHHPCGTCAIDDDDATLIDTVELNVTV